MWLIQVNGSYLHLGGVNLMIDILNFWKEYGNENAPSVKDSFESVSYAEKEKIAEYLENGHVNAITMGLFEDVVTGKPAAPEKYFTDGKYLWDSSIPYYVRKYNLRLPREFEQHVLEYCERE